MLESVTHEMIDLVSSSCMSAGGWQSVLDRTADLFPGTKLSLHAEDGLSRGNIGLVHHGLSDAFVREYAAYYSTVNPWTPRWLRLPLLQAQISDEILPPADLMKTEFYNDLLRRDGEMHHAAGIKLIEEKERFASLSLYYGDRQTERYNRELTRFLQDLAPYLRAALDISRQLHVGCRPPQTITDLVDAFGSPACLVSSEQVVLYANRLFVEQGRPFEIDRFGRLTLSDHRFRQRFRQLVSDKVTRATRIDAEPDPCGILEIPDDGAGTTTISIFGIRSLMSAPFRRFWGGRAYALVSIARTGIDHGRLASILRTRHGLTRSEVQLCLCLANRQTLRQAATYLNVTYETVRSQLKMVFSKINVHRQAELVLFLWSQV